MILVLSPSKTLDFETAQTLAPFTHPDMLLKSQALVAELKTYSTDRLADLMDISDKLASLNAQRYRNFQVPFTAENARQAFLAFKGDVYDGIEVEHYTPEDFAFAQEHVRILSGLYGLLRPLDLIQPYRLEMGTRLKTRFGKDLYDFWGDSITQALDHQLKQQKKKLLINLASNEYFKAVKPQALSCPVIDMVFKEKKKGEVKIVGLFAKKARGLMANYIIQNRIDEPRALKDFKAEGYRYAKSLSADDSYIFVR